MLNHPARAKKYRPATAAHRRTACRVPIRIGAHPRRAEMIGVEERCCRDTAACLLGNPLPAKGDVIRPCRALLLGDDHRPDLEIVRHPRR
jgi:hypothetical protein